jgi:hypothetical protein
MKVKTLLMFSSSVEFVTGVVLIAAPSLVANVLLSAGLTAGGEAIGRVCGFGLISLALACWPVGEGDQPQPVKALFLYNLLAACYLGYLRIGGEFTSFFLLPAFVLHGVLAMLFARPAYRSVVANGQRT